MRKELILAAALAAAISLPTSSHAAVIYSNLAGGSYSCCGSYTAGGMVHWGVPELTAIEFTSGLTTALTKIDLGLSHTSGVNSGTVALWTANGGIPDTLLASWNVYGLPAFTSTGTTLTTISGISGVTLQAGTSYFLALGPVSNSDDSVIDWNWASPLLMGTNFAYNNGGAWHPLPGYTAPLPAFDVIGKDIPVTPAPEPGTLALMLAGIAGALRFRRRSAAE